LKGRKRFHGFHRTREAALDARKAALRSERWYFLETFCKIKVAVKTINTLLLFIVWWKIYNHGVKHSVSEEIV
jgi:hypothetical protein